MGNGTSQSLKMGAGMSWVSGLLWAKKEIRILILGLVLPSRHRARDLRTTADRHRDTGQRWQDNTTLPFKGSCTDINPASHDAPIDFAGRSEK